jgi:hypothetical protein
VRCEEQPPDDEGEFVLSGPDRIQRVHLVQLSRVHADEPDIDAPRAIRGSERS